MDTVKPAKILIVDDEPRLVDLLMDTLSEAGYEVDGVVTGSAAIHSARREVYQVALLDYNLEDMTGLALAQELRRLNEDLSVILITAHASLDMAVKAIQADVYDYLIKPVDSNLLLRSVSNAAEKCGLQSENKALIANLKTVNAELERLSEFKSKFLSVVTHDLRSPLASIRGYSQLLLEQPQAAPERAGEFLKIIIKQTDHLAALISDLMDIASIEAGKLSMDKAPCSLKDLLASVQERMAPLAVQRRIRFKMASNGELPQMALDRRRIDQVLTNLIGNAFKHTPADGLVTVEARREGPRVRVEVTDTGDGIPPAEIERIFTQFYQVQAQASHREGLGLGLTIAREIVGAHGGDIGAESEGPGKGARFWFTLPVPQSAPPAEPANQNSGPSER